MLGQSLQQMHVCFELIFTRFFTFRDVTPGLCNGCQSHCHGHNQISRGTIKPFSCLTSSTLRRTACPPLEAADVTHARIGAWRHWRVKRSSHERLALWRDVTWLMTKQQDPDARARCFVSSWINQTLPSLNALQNLASCYLFYRGVTGFL